MTAIKPKYLLFSCLISSALVTACGSDSNSDTMEQNKCTADACKDSSTLLKCDTISGKTEEQNCTNGCENNACKAKADDTKCTADACKDSSTLLKCDTISGKTEEQNCTNGCENNACKAKADDTKCTADACKDSSTLLKCDTKSGKTEEQNCTNGCENNACKALADDPKCTADACASLTTLYKCDLSTGTVSEIACQGECTDNACAVYQCKDSNILLKTREDTGETSEIACKNGCLDSKCADTPDTAMIVCNPANFVPTCIDETRYADCYDTGNAEGIQQVKICANGRKCKDGACVLTEEAACEIDVCKNLTTLSKCTDGKYIDESCGEGKICMNDACTDAGSIIPCTEGGTECESGQVCYQGVCYTKTNFDMKVGDKCDASVFEEYCQGNIEYKCGYTQTVETNDCTDYNGCSLYIKPAYSSHKPIRNASCRGTDDRLAECGRPGATNISCVNMEDLYMPFYYSLQDVCFVGTDGRMIYGQSSYETNCSKKCNNINGMCVK